MAFWADAKVIVTPRSWWRELKSISERLIAPERRTFGDSACQAMPADGAHPESRVDPVTLDITDISDIAIAMGDIQPLSRASSASRGACLPALLRR
jgi:hypothetical protein